MIFASYSSMARFARRVATAASLALAVALNMVCCTATVPSRPMEATTMATITSTSEKPAASERGRRRLRERSVDGRAIAEVRVPVRGRAAEETWIGDLSAQPARVIWSGLTGPRDADGEASLYVEVTPERIFEYQTAEQVSRCDGLF